jgi:serine phosphatase RsbU (regulator of sigma subunit)
MLLGFDRQPPLPEESFRLAAGDSVVFYTDGLIDAHAPARVVHLSQLSSVLASCAGSSPPEVIAEIERSLLADFSGEPRDDIAILVLRVGPAGS